MWASKRTDSGEENGTGFRRRVVQEDDLESNSGDSTPITTRSKPVRQDTAQDVERKTESKDEPDRRSGLKRDFTQTSVSSNKDCAVDENDWAKRNQGKKKVTDLVAKFAQKAEANKEVSSAPYKTDYGMGKTVGQIQQDKFH
ncbi:hypothetical protein Ddc_05568 [Ditylenchus destructor]|nr:hypothetical protein Ddc_05568 [Ditylenchus destructor]